MPLQPTPTEQELLLSQLAGLNLAEIREFMAKYEVGGREGVKAVLLQLVGAALRDGGGPTWDQLVLYLDGVEPFGRQHVYLFKPRAALKQWGDRAAVEERLRAARLVTLLDSRTALAAPDAVTLSSISLDEQVGAFTVHAVSRRSFLRRRSELDEEVNAPRAAAGNLIAHVYEKISVRSWVRLRVETKNGRCSLQVSQLERKADYEAIVTEFLDLVRHWFPVDTLEPINLARAIASLEADYETNRDTAEVRVQAAAHDTHGGRHHAVSSSRARQGVLGESAALDGAVKAMRESGPAASGNFYFLPDDAPGSANPIAKDLHVTCVARDHRINVRRPTTAEELAWVLGRIRHHGN